MQEPIYDILPPHEPGLEYGENAADIAADVMAAHIAAAPAIGSYVGETRGGGEADLQAPHTSVSAEMQDSPYDRSVTTSTGPRYAPHAELCHFLGCEEPATPLTRDALLALLLSAGVIDEIAPQSPAVRRWQRHSAAALRKKHSVDAWAHYEIHKRPTELAIRWDYDIEKKKWRSLETLIKMEATPFAHGAMRECYRMKNMSQVNASYFSRMNWEDCNNYVAKRYLAKAPKSKYAEVSDDAPKPAPKPKAPPEETEAVWKPPSSLGDEDDESDVSDKVYWTDIKMQMVSKRYARLYNMRIPPPPKKVDFLQAFVIEVQRVVDGETTRMLFCVEVHVDGDYTKHSNNSGFVQLGQSYESASSEESCQTPQLPATPQLPRREATHYRATPHAFSRFTFEASQGKLMIVDIQGVGDIYTDPQIHTLDGTGFGAGNLSVGGMALFFSTAHYDNLCIQMELLNFALSADEKKRIEGQRPEWNSGKTTEHLLSGASTAVRDLIKASADKLAARRISVKSGCLISPSNQAPSGSDHIELDVKLLLESGALKLLDEDDDGQKARHEAGLPPPSMDAPAGGVPAPSAVGLVHAKLVEFNLTGALPLLEGQRDVLSAGFHLVCAAAASEPRALRDLRSLLRGLRADELLPGVSLSGENLEKLGAQYLPRLNARLAAAGDACAMLELANQLAAHEADEATAARKALKWIDAALAVAAQATSDKEKADLAMGCCALYQLYERQAELCRQVGDDRAASESYASASEAALEAGKARLAMTLQTKSEECASRDED